MPRSKTAVVAPKPPVIVSKTPEPIAVQSPSLMQTMKEGVAFGTGSGLARIMLDRLFNTNDKETSYDACSEKRMVFERCLIDQSEHIFCRKQENALNDCLTRK